MVRAGPTTKPPLGRMLNSLVKTRPAWLATISLLPTASAEKPAGAPLLMAEARAAVISSGVSLVPSASLTRRVKVLVAPWLTAMAPVPVVVTAAVSANASAARLRIAREAPVAAPLKSTWPLPALINPARAVEISSRLSTTTLL